MKSFFEDRIDVRSQHQFQLHSIAESLEPIVHTLRQRIDAGESEKHLALRKGQNSISLRVNSDHHDSVTAEIEFKPLFPGSHTQQEVAVCGAIRLDTKTSNKRTTLEKQRLQRQSAQTGSVINPLDPALHFARFNALPASDNRPFTSSGRKIVILWKPEVWSIHGGIRVARDDQQLLQILEKAAAESSGDCHLIVVCLNPNKPMAQRLHKHKKQWEKVISGQSDGKTIDIHIIELHECAPVPLMTILSRADCALVADVSMAMDCLNANCPFTVYDTNSTKEHAEHAGHAGHAGHAEHAEHDYPFRFADIAEQARTKKRAYLAKTQQHSLAAETVITDNGELKATINHWFESILSDTTSATTPQNELAITAPIIPVNKKQKSRVLFWLGTSRAKLRKLRQSPRQFMQDSQNPGLRLLGRLSI